ncbi:MAG: tripartite tricarboxylate transporter substrate-binding protein [Reyranellales bacterium]
MHGQNVFPDKALRILVGYSAGGGAELMARVIAPQLQLRVGRHVWVDNKPNNTGARAGEFLSMGLAEGSVVAFMPSTTLAPRLVGTAFPFDASSQLVPLTMAGTFQVALAASPKIGVTTLADYVGWLKAGSAGRAQLGTTATDLYLKLYSMMIGREVGVTLKDLPQRNAASLVTALKDGTIPAGIGSITTLMQHNFDGKVRLLATSGAKRTSVLRQVPTVVELGYPKLELREWYGFFGSSASPGPVLAEWNRQLRGVLADTEVAAALGRFGLDVETSTQEEAVAQVASHLRDWKARMESFGMKSAD